MTETTMVVATPATAPPTAATAAATSTPVDGAFTVLLAVALGDVPPTAVTMTDRGDGVVTAGEVAVAPPAAGEAEGDAGDPAALLAAALAAAGAEVMATDRPVRRDAVGPPSGGLPVADGPAVSEVPVAAEEATATVGSELTVRFGTATATTSDRAVTAATTRTTASLETSAELTAPTAGEGRAEAARSVDAPPSSSPASGTSVSSAGHAGSAADVAARAALTDAPTGSSDLHARVLGRVMDALDVLENAPPPRRLTIDLPDGDGMRLHVALRGGEVHVSVVGGGAAGDLSGWSRDLTDALAARGFSLGGFGAGADQDGHRPPADGDQPADDPTDPRPRLRPRADDHGLRL